MTTSSKLATGNGFPNIVVTGVAMTTALATDAETTWKLLLDGQSGIRTLEDPFVKEFDLPVRIGGHLLEEFDSQLNRVENRRMGYLQKMATVLDRQSVGERGFARGGYQPVAGVRRHRDGLERGADFRYDGMRERA